MAAVQASYNDIKVRMLWNSLTLFSMMYAVSVWLTVLFSFPSLNWTVIIMNDSQVRFNKCKLYLNISLLPTMHSSQTTFLNFKTDF